MKINDYAKIYNLGLDGKAFLECVVKILSIEQTFNNRRYCKVLFKDSTVGYRWINEYDVLKKV